MQLIDTLLYEVAQRSHAALLYLKRRSNSSSIYIWSKQMAVNSLHEDFIIDGRPEWLDARACYLLVKGTKVRLIFSEVGFRLTKMS